MFNRYNYLKHSKFFGIIFLILNFICAIYKLFCLHYKTFNSYILPNGILTYVSIPIIIILIVESLPFKITFDTNIDKLSSKKSKHYLLLSILFIIVFILLYFNKISFNIIIHIGFCIVILLLLYLINKSILNFRYSKAKNILKESKIKAAVVDSVSLSWKFKIWFKPFCKIPLKERSLHINKLITLFILISFLYKKELTIILAIIYFSLILLEYYIGLCTYIDGICTSVIEYQSKISDKKLYKIIVVDFKNKREIKILLDDNINNYRRGNYLRVYIGIFTRKHIKDILI